MESEFLQHPGSLLITGQGRPKIPSSLQRGHRRTPSAAPATLPPRDSSPPHSMEEDFEPLTAGDLHIGAGDIPELRLPGRNPTAPDFNPPNPPTTPSSAQRDELLKRLKELEVPGGKSNVRVLPSLKIYPSQSGNPRYGLGFNPKNLFGENWVDAYAMHVALFYRDNVIDFAKKLAGKLQYRSVNDVLETGFEDLHALVRSAQMNSSDLPASSHPDNSYPPAPYTMTENMGFQVNGYNKAMHEFYEIATMLSPVASGEDSLKFFRYLTRRSEQRDAAYQQWLTLPMNLSRYYFNPIAKAGIEAALDAVAGNYPLMTREALFSAILLSAAREVFGELVVLFIQRDRFSNPNGDRRRHTGEYLQQRINAALGQFLSVSLSPIRSPDETALPQLMPASEPLAPLPLKPVKPEPTGSALLSRIAFDFT